jgi:hypothetical protein
MVARAMAMAKVMDLDGQYTTVIFFVLFDVIQRSSSLVKSWTPAFSRLPAKLVVAR